MSRVPDLDEFLDDEDPEWLDDDMLDDDWDWGYLAGEKSEQERIIKLLRARVTKHHPVLEMHIEELEALIKGEQK